MVKDIAKNNHYLRKIFSYNTDRMITNELVLRYLAVSENFDRDTNEIRNYDGRIKNLINSYMKKYQNADDDILEDIKIKFEQQIKKAYLVFGDKAFKKNDKTTKPNAALYECIMMSFEDYSEDDLLTSKLKIRQLLAELLQTDEFVKAIDKATGNTEVLNLRNRIFRLRLGEIMNDAGQKGF